MKWNRLRLRASRMRLETTTSLSGPVPFSHSPDCWTRSSMVMPRLLWCLTLALVQIRLEPSDLVAELGGLLEILGLDDPFELPLEAGELGLLADDGFDRVGRLAGVLDGPVDLLQERDEARLEDLVIVGASEPRLGLELRVRDPALGAARRARFGGRLAGGLRGLDEVGQDVGD